MGRAVAAVPPRVAPLSTENLGKPRRCAPRVGGRRHLRARRCTPARLGRHIRQRRQQHPPTAWTPHALPLTDVPASSALGAHLDHQTSLVTSPPRTGTALSAPSTGVEAGFRAGLGAPGRGTSSTTQLPTTIHSFHSFIHSGKNPTNGVNTGSIRQPGPQLWITAPVNAFSSTAWQVPERNGLSH